MRLNQTLVRYSKGKGFTKCLLILKHVEVQTACPGTQVLRVVGYFHTNISDTRVGPGGFKTCGKADAENSLLHFFTI